MAPAGLREKKPGTISLERRCFRELGLGIQGHYAIPAPFKAREGERVIRTSQSPPRIGPSSLARN